MEPEQNQYRIGLESMETVQNLRSWLTTNIASNAVYGRVGYVYGYPHKKAYRALPPRAPDEVWRHESRDRLFCYVHVPFCSQRCSFCNLFTYVPGGDDPAERYLDALARQMGLYAAMLRPMRFTRLYVGGGTPTYLDTGQLRRLTAALRDVLGVDPAQTPGCIEASPETVDEEKVGVLRELGFQRISLGVQSFVADELRHVNRRFEFARNRAAVETIGRAGFPHFNLDLIYGLPGQTARTWLASLDEAVASPATSLFLYPLYVRPLTGLDRRPDLPPAPSEPEMARMYDLAVVQLSGAGFRQLTMRQFRRDVPTDGTDLEYRCQSDGMLGLGAGARTYTTGLHYSTPWRMVARNIRSVVEDYRAAMRAGDALIRHGFDLDEDERQRRFVIVSLLYDGVDRRAFAAAFGAEAGERFAPQWDALAAEDCVAVEDDAIRLTPRGVRHADVVGQLFFSERVRRLMDTYEYDR
jgi:oxygen-independent coproporphyrinogen-3 oxidase